MDRFAYIFIAICLLCAAGTAVALPPIEKGDQVDIRAVGDTGYVGKNKSFVVPPSSFVNERLAALAKLKSPDINFLNLEGSLTRSCKKFTTNRYGFAIAPAFVTQLANWGFNMMALANNHTTDCKNPSLSRELPHAIAAAKKDAPALIMHGAATQGDLLHRVIPGLKLRGVHAGLASIKLWGNGSGALVGNADNADDILAALRDSRANVRILSLHGGRERMRVPDGDMIEMARRFIADYKGDIVFAHHSHSMQGFEVLKREDGRVGVIFYSLGNFLHDGLSTNGDGMMARVIVGPDGVNQKGIEVFPLVNEERWPAPGDKHALERAIVTWQASNRGVYARKLPANLRRVRFLMYRINTPAFGLRLKPVEDKLLVQP